MQRKNTIDDLQHPIPQDCPILEDTAHLQGLSQDMLRTLRKLKRDLRNCEKCACVYDCPVLKEFNASVQTAIQEVLDEWNLG
jgi:hypothetical protein